MMEKKPVTENEKNENTAEKLNDEVTRLVNGGAFEDWPKVEDYDYPSDSEDNDMKDRI